METIQYKISSLVFSNKRNIEILRLNTKTSLNDKYFLYIWNNFNTY